VDWSYACRADADDEVEALARQSIHTYSFDCNLVAAGCKTMQEVLNFGGNSFDRNSMNLARFTSFYRRDSDEVIGAVRLSAVESVSMEQMPGGRFQIVARTTAGSDGFVSCVMGTLSEGQRMLDEVRSFLGGESEENPAEKYLADRERAREEHEIAEAERLEAEQRELRDSWTPPSQ
jgi:hypothetical protein